MNKTPAFLSILVTLLSLFWCNLVFAVQLNAFKTFPADNPLSYQSIQAIAQDKHGFIWFGSQTSLHRYDGHQIINYHHDEANSNSLSQGGVTRLIIDKSGMVWAGTRGGGVSMFNPNTNTFTNLNSNSGDIALTGDIILSLHEDSKGNIWIGTNNGINLVKRSDSQLTVEHIQYSKTAAIEDLLETQNETMWIATDQGIVVFDLDGHFIRNISLGENSDNNIRTLTQRKNGIIWIGTYSSGIFKYNPQSFTYQQYRQDDNDVKSISSNTINDILIDAQNNIWIGSDKGLLIYNDNADNFTRYSHNANDKTTLANDVVSDFFEDRDGLVWIATFGGVNLWDPNVTSFERYTPLNQPNLAHSHISGFSQSTRQEIYISGYGGGIYRLDKSTNIIHRIELNNYFKDKAITVILAEQNNLWVGTRGHGLYKVELESKNITPYRHNPDDSNTIAGDAISSIIRDHRGRIWLSSFGSGISRIDHDNKITRFVKSEQNPEQGPSSNNVIQLLLDSEGYIWVTIYGSGISRLDIESELFVHIRHDETDPKSLSSDVTFTSYKDSKGSLWVGTQDAGMSILSLENQRRQNWEFERLDIIDGMKNSNVFGFIEDNNQDIWFLSSQGISRYSPLTLKFSYFGPAHGLVDNQFNHGAAFRDSDGRLYFGSTKGFNAITPEEITLNTEPPKTYLTDILRLNEPMQFNEQLSNVTDLTFKYSDRLISFEYVGLNFSNPEATSYRYRMQGFDEQWIDAGKLKRATYTNLPSGRFTFEVIASNDEQNWASEGRKLNITIEPAPWQTWWAYLLYATAVALALLGYSRFVNRKLQVEQQQKIDLKQQVEEQTKEFQLKNVELENANKQLENAATTDKLTGVRSRRYLDIYIEQATRLMSQIHVNLLPVQRNILPRLYFLMVRINDVNKINKSQLVNLTDLLLYTRNDDDLVIRWSEDTFGVIGFEKDDNARELASRLVSRFKQIFDDNVSVDMAYCFYPFNFEQPMALSWDQISVLTEFALNRVRDNSQLDWLGLYAPKEQPFDYLEAIKLKNLDDLSQYVKIRRSNMGSGVDSDSSIHSEPPEQEI